MSVTGREWAAHSTVQRHHLRRLKVGRAREPSPQRMWRGPAAMSVRPAPLGSWSSFLMWQVAACGLAIGFATWREEVQVDLPRDVRDG